MIAETEIRVPPEASGDASELTARLARRLGVKIGEITGKQPHIGFLNINLYRDDDVARELPGLTEAVRQGSLAASVAAQRLLALCGFTEVG